MNNVEILCPSYGRGGSVTTHKVVSGAVYVVCESQAHEYTGVDIKVCPDSAQGCLCRVRNWILNECGGSCIILDDDHNGIKLSYGTERKTRILNAEDARDQLINLFNLAQQLNIHFFGVNCAGGMPNSCSWRNPFALKSYIGGPIQGHYKNECRYDSNLNLKEDYDMTAQVLTKHGGLLRANFLAYSSSKQHKLKGGCASYRTTEKERDQFELLLKKWPMMFRRDIKNPNDINPIFRQP